MGEKSRILGAWSLYEQAARRIDFQKREACRQAFNRFMADSDHVHFSTVLAACSVPIRYPEGDEPTWPQKRAAALAFQTANPDYRVVLVRPSQDDRVAVDTSTLLKMARE